MERREQTGGETQEERKRQRENEEKEYTLAAQREVSNWFSGDQWCSGGSQWCPPTNAEQYFGLFHLEWWCYWHLVGRVQRYC